MAREEMFCNVWRANFLRIQISPSPCPLRPLWRIPGLQSGQFRLIEYPYTIR